MLLKQYNFLHVLLKQTQTGLYICLVFYHFCTQSLQVEMVRISFKSENVTQNLWIVVDKRFPNIRHFIFYEVIQVNGVLGIDKVPLVQFCDKIFAVGPIKHRIVDYYLMIAWFQESGKGEPFLSLDIVSGQLRPVDTADVGQFVVVGHVRDDVGPPFKFRIYAYLIH